MGGFEPVAKPWKVDPIPSTFQFQLLDEDWEQFEILMVNAIHRTPALETAEIKMLLNGPESFTPDGNFLLGEAPELRNYFVAAGFNSAGIANAGGAGRLVPEWIVGGEAAPTSGTSTCAGSAASRRTAGRCTCALPRRWGCTTPCAGRGRSCRRRGHCAVRRCTTPSPPRVPSSARRTAGSASTTSNRGPRPPATRSGGLAGCRGYWRSSVRRATRSRCTTSRRLPSSRSPGATRSRCCSACVPTTSTCRDKPHGLHGDAQRARRFRERPHRDPARRGAFLIVTGSAQAVRDPDWISRHIAPTEHARRPMSRRCIPCCR